MPALSEFLSENPAVMKIAATAFAIGLIAASGTAYRHHTPKMPERLTLSDIAPGYESLLAAPAYSTDFSMMNIVV